jgi:hypothetical protein
MAEMCQLSRSRFYDLIDAGVFPRPALHPASGRPMYDHGLIQTCLEVRRTGVGANGLPVLFNRKPATAPARPKRAPAPAPDHADLIAALKGLGLAATPQAVGEALAALYPAGTAGLDRGGVVRKVFLRLQAGGT